MAERFTKTTPLPHDAETVFAWHMAPGAFERLTPPWERVTVAARPEGGLGEGAEVTLKTALGPLSLSWVAAHEAFEPGRQFRDVQVEGPFASWRHTHRFEPRPEGGSTLVDDIEYRLPFGPLGRWFGGGLVKSKLERMFAYRHRVTAADLDAHARRRGQQHMKIAIGGASGLIGKALGAFLGTGGHEVARLVRPSAEADGGSTISWDPYRAQIDAAALEGLDAVVLLSGENVAGGRWTRERKRKIMDSRTLTTRVLSEALARAENKPKVLVCASAIGYYGDQGDQVLTERSRKGEGFLSDVCEAWEDSTRPAADAGIRVVNLRIGVVLSPEGGALAKMLPAFKVGAGGVLGSGEQYMSWISIEDVVGAIQHAIDTESLEGPVNLCAPNPVTNRELTETLGRVLGRPTVVPAPAFALRALFGREMADQTVLASQRVHPKRLEDSGYTFRHPDLEPALRALLGR